MKGVKLKPLFFQENDIIVSPPKLLKPLEPAKSLYTKVIVSKIDDLSNLIRGRRLKKRNQTPDKGIDDVEQVKKLSNFRAQSNISNSNSAIRRFTFKRLGTLRFTEQIAASKHLPKFIEDSIANMRQK